MVIIYSGSDGDGKDVVGACNDDDDDDVGEENIGTESYWL